MIDLGMMNHSGTHTYDQLLRQVEDQLALGDSGNESSAKERKKHLLLMIHPRVGPVFPNILSETKKIVDASAETVVSGKPKKEKLRKEHVLTSLCYHQAHLTLGPPLTAFTRSTKVYAAKIGGSRRR